MYHISKETAEDRWEVEDLFDLSFGAGREALSSYRLREGTPRIKDLCLIVRDAESVLAGAIRFWPIRVGAQHARALLLGPIAVHPTRQGEGIGAFLISEALDRAEKMGWSRVILVGDEPYYARFGFEVAQDILFPPPTNPNRVLRKELKENAFSGVNGVIIAERECSTQRQA
ncbi:MAG: N-acetyltransferase [Pseudomonadota bacterium]